MKIVAEAGTSYEGSLDKAKLLVECAKECGADCVKFQWVYADEILHPRTGLVHLPTGDIPLYERFRQLEVNPDFFATLRDFCRNVGIEFMCSPFGLKSLTELLQIEPDYIKIASPELNYVQLLKKLKQENTKNIPVVLSSGVSKLHDIENAVSIFENSEILKKNNLTLLHCITSYPAPEEEYNLNLICSLHSIFGIPTGISDHSLNPLYVPLLAQALEATMLEKHITLDNEGSGLDDPVALNPKNFKLMCQTVKEFSKADDVRDYTISYLQNQIGDKVIKILGNGIKKLAPSEEKNYGRTNRSLRFIKDKKCGEKIEKDDIAILRTEKILEVGLEPKFLDDIIGSRLTKDVISGDAVNWACLTTK